MYAEGRVEHQKRTQTAALLSFGFVFGVQLGSLEKLRREPVRAVMVHILKKKHKAYNYKKSIQLQKKDLKKLGKKRLLGELNHTNIFVR